MSEQASAVRPEQLHAAETVARYNPEWSLARSLAGITLHAFDGAGVVVNRAGQVVWLAYRHEGGYMVGRNGGVRRFLSPVTAIRALGYALPIHPVPTPATVATRPADQ